MAWFDGKRELSAYDLCILDEIEAEEKERDEEEEFDDDDGEY